jgi:hypothetical protein
MDLRAATPIWNPSDGWRVATSVAARGEFAFNLRGLPGSGAGPFRRAGTGPVRTALRSDNPGGRDVE